jgi:uncharacterized protein (TIGR03437 family)
MLADMRSGCVLLLLLSSLPPALAIPGIVVRLTVRNAASPEAGIAPGSLVRIGIDGSPSPAPPATERLQVLFAPDRGEAIPAASLTRLSDYSLQVVVPREVALGEATVKLLLDGEPYLGARASISAAAPGLFTINPAGAGPALAQIYPGGSTSLNSRTNPAPPGAAVTLWITGLGDTQPADVTVDIGGSPAQVTFAGRHSVPGLDQVNIRLAAAAPLGCYVPVVVRAGGVESNVGTLSINDSPGYCPHPLGVEYSDLVTLDGGGRILVGSLDLWSQTQDEPPVPASSASARAGFYWSDASEVFRLAQPQRPYSPKTSCRVLSGVAAVIRAPFSEDAGAALLLTGPGGRQVRLERVIADYSILLPEAAFPSGSWQFSAPGGAGLAAFRTAFVLPPSTRWTNRSEPAVIRRHRDVEIRWNPAGFGPGDRMAVTLARPPGGIRCEAYAWQGALSLPQALLQLVSRWPIKPI